MLSLNPYATYVPISLHAAPLAFNQACKLKGCVEWVSLLVYVAMTAKETAKEAGDVWRRPVILFHPPITVSIYNFDDCRCR